MPPRQNPADNEDAPNAVDYLADLFEMDIQRLARIMTNLGDIPIEPKVEVEGVTTESIANQAEAAIETTNNVIEEIKETMEEERALRDDWRKAVSKLRIDDKAQAEGWWTQQRTAANWDELIITLQDRKRSHNAVLVDSKSKLREAKRLIQAAATLVLPPAPPAPRVLSKFRTEQLTVDVFDGTATKWLSFWNMLTASLDNMDANETQKFAYLISKLTGDPRKLIENLPLTPANYQAALRLLQRRYGNEKAIARAVRSRLFSLPVCITMEDVHEVFTDAESCLIQLETLTGNQIDSEDTFHFLEQRLPIRYLSRVMNKRKPGEDFGLPEFREVMRTIIEEDEEMNQIRRISKTSKWTEPPSVEKSDRSANKKIQQRNQQQQRERGIKGSMAFLGAAQSINQQQGRPFKAKPCIFCGRNGHRIYLCPFSQKERWDSIRRANRCAKCFKEGHFASNCQAEQCRKCGKDHHTFICPTSVAWETRPNSIPILAKATQFSNCFPAPIPNQTSTNALATGRQEVQLMTRIVTVYNPDTGLESLAALMVDAGSTESYISKRISTLLSLENGPNQAISLTRFGDKAATKFFTGPLNRIGIRSPEDKNLEIEAIAVDDFLPTMNFINVSFGELERLRETGSEIPTIRRKPDILIGIQDMGRINLHYRETLPNGVYLYNSTIGPFLCGKIKRPRITASISTALHQKPTKGRNSDTEAYALLSKYLAAESIGDLSDNYHPTDDEIVHENFLRTLKYEETTEPIQSQPPGRYVVSLPWKDDSRPCINYKPALGRMLTTLSKLRRDPELLKQYDQIIKDQLNDGILEVVPSNELNWESSKCYYHIPHQHVVKETSSTTKLRIVGDASSGTPSLNDCLHRGKVWAGQHEKAVTSFVARCRMMAHAVVLDLEKAFLQIKLKTDDKDVHRLLWPADPFRSNTPRILRSTRVTFGVISSPYLLGATLDFHLSKSKDILARTLVRGAYVDNFIIPVNDRTEVAGIVQRSREIFWEAGFNARQFASDLRDEIQRLPAELQEKKTTISLLGINWNTVSDTWVLSFPKMKEPATKRNLLSTLASMFDPNGFVAPAILPAKLLQATIWTTKLGWDDPIPEELRREYENIKQTWNDAEIHIPRKIFCRKSGDTTHLHGFADASTQAIGYAIYARDPATNKSGLIFARALVVPTSFRPKPKRDGKERTISIPRLELQALYLASRAMQQLYMSIQNVSEQTLWTDSTTSIHWLENSKERSNPEVFVRNRISKIRHHKVKHVSTCENPADLASRGCTPSQLLGQRLWFHGPEWLQEPEERWPVPLLEYEPRYISVQEKDSVDPTTKILAVGIRINNPQADDMLFQKIHANSLYSIQRTVVTTLRAIKLFMQCLKKDSKIKAIKETQPMDCPICPTEMYHAQVILMKEAQKIYPPDESTRLNLRIFQESDGLLRCRGRFPQHAPMAYTAKYPIFLSKSAPIVALLIKRIHLSLLHCGPSTLIAEYRQNYWTPQLRQKIRNVILQDPETKCLACFTFIAKPANHPKEPDLPLQRLQLQIAFENTGIDFFWSFQSQA